MVYNGNDGNTENIVSKLRLYAKCKVQFCANSTSRAENLTYVLDHTSNEMCDNVVFADADDRPEKYCIATLQTELNMHDCVAQVNCVMSRSNSPVCDWRRPDNERMLLNAYP